MSHVNGNDHQKEGGDDMVKKKQLSKDREAAASITKQLAELDTMTTGELAEKYQEVYGKPTRSHNKRYLIKRIAWQIQALAEGGLSDKALAKIEELVPHFPERWQAVLQGKAVEAMAKKPMPLPTRDPRLPKPGTVITRVHKGVEHKVTILDDGFDYNGEHYKTLSKLARVITGTPWNGYLFFHLEHRTQNRQKGVTA